MILTSFILLLDHLKALISCLHGNNTTCNSVRRVSVRLTTNICASREMFPIPVTTLLSMTKVTNQTHEQYLTVNY